MYLLCFVSKKIVGLTASVGVGKAEKEEKAMGWIISMMANMDAEELSVVEENKAELAQHVYIPDQGRIIVVLILFISLKIVKYIIQKLGKCTPPLSLSYKCQVK